MQHQAGQTHAPDGVRLYTQAWQPDGAPKAAIGFIHGQAEHSGRYHRLAHALADAGYAMFMIDLRGHGKSDGARGHINRITDYLQDAAAALDGARSLAPGALPFLGGHSLGGQIALRYALGHPEELRGVVASGPFLRLALVPPPELVAIGRTTSSVIPGLTFSNQLNSSLLSHDKAVVEAYDSDPLVHGKVTARAYTELIAGGEYLLEHAGAFKLPLLLMHGDEDGLCDPAAVRTFYERIGSEDCTYHVYKGFYHEIFNEIEKEKPLADLIAWLDARCDSDA